MKAWNMCKSVVGTSSFAAFHLALFGVRIAFFSPRHQSGQSVESSYRRIPSPFKQLDRRDQSINLAQTISTGGTNLSKGAKRKSKNKKVSCFSSVPRVVEELQFASGSSYRGDFHGSPPYKSVLRSGSEVHQTSKSTILRIHNHAHGWNTEKVWS